MGKEERFALPESLLPLRGQINDADSHENIPVNLWVEVYGPVMTDMVEAISQSGLPNAAQNSKDDSEITTHNVNTLKFEKAPGAFDFKRRIEVMDFIGLDCQVMYPGGLGLYALGLYNRPNDLDYLRTIRHDRKGYAKRMVDTYNEWCSTIYRDSTRLRPIAMLAEDTPDDLHAAAKRYIDRGIGGLWIPTDHPPGNVSPASPALDRFWALLADSNTPVLAHIGSEINSGPLHTLEWRNAPAFEGWMVGREFSLDPWTMCTMHLGTQVFLMTMILGGVFERHPRLRFGSAEFNGHWVGPLAENMDTFYSKARMGQNVGRVLKQKPSDYLRRNVRIALFDFEPVGAYIDRYGLEDVYCYASDYPHIEGGLDPIGNSERALAGQSDAIRRKFYVDNCKWLLPV